MPLALERDPPVRAARAADRRVLHALDDAQVALRHLGGDPQAFGGLVDRYQARLLTFINRALGDRERAEDLVQEVFIRVFRHLHRFDRTKKFSTWIYTIASNLTKTELRVRRRSLLVRHWPVEVEDEAAGPDRLFGRADLANAVSHGVRQLPGPLREVFVLRELEGMSYDEIADITRCNVGTVRSRLSRARSGFAKVIEPLVS